jgi:lactam utilization protein B
MLELSKISWRHFNKHGATYNIVTRDPATHTKQKLNARSKQCVRRERKDAGALNIFSVEMSSLCIKSSHKWRSLYVLQEINFLFDAQPLTE